MVSGTLMNLADNPNRVSIYQGWRENDLVQRVPIIVTGNDFSTLFAPLIRDGRMSKFYWEPDRLDLMNILHQMYKVLSQCQIFAVCKKLCGPSCRAVALAFTDMAGIRYHSPFQSLELPGCKALPRQC